MIINCLFCNIIRSTRPSIYFTNVKVKIIFLQCCSIESGHNFFSNQNLVDTRDVKIADGFQEAAEARKSGRKNAFLCGANIFPKYSK